MAALLTLKLRGLTSGSSTLATVDVTVDSDARLRFTDSNGVKRSIPIEGDFARLLREAFAGASGLASTRPIFDSPVVSIAGDGFRVNS